MNSALYCRRLLVAVAIFSASIGLSKNDLESPETVVSPPALVTGQQAKPLATQEHSSEILKARREAAYAAAKQEFLDAQRAKAENEERERLEKTEPRKGVSIASISPEVVREPAAMAGPSLADKILGGEAAARLAETRAVGNVVYQKVPEVPDASDSATVSVGLDDPKLRAAELEYWIEYWDYELRKIRYNEALLSQKEENLGLLYSQRNQAFATQAWFGWISMIVVHLLFLMGIFLAVIEARRAGKAPPSEVQDELKLSFEAIALKSRYLSVAILALTLGFYMLYLKFVYPIAEL